MFKNHLKFAFRLFIKDRFYSLLNIAGLTLGITTGIILLLVLNYDLNYDKHHKKHERIYRYTQKLKAPGAEFNVALSAPELMSVLYQDLPEAEYIVRIQNVSRSLVSHATQHGIENQFLERNIIRADSTLFDVFTHKVLKGDPETALKGRNKVVISETIAEKFFGGNNGLGEILMMPDSQLYEVSAIIEDLPDNSHVKYNIILSGIPPRNPQGDLQISEAYWNPEVYTYILFKEGTNPQVFYDRFPQIHNKTYKLFENKINGEVTPLIEPLADIHFHSTKLGDYPKGDIKFLYASIAIGIFIILLACINYVNMSTARSTKRTTEMAIRKVLGIHHLRLFSTVLSEALIMAFIAMILAIFISYYIIEISGFTDLLGRDLSFNLFNQLHLLKYILLLAIVIGLFSGLYPALYIPSVPVVTALKGTKVIKLSGGSIRKVLIGFQFFLSLTVIICTVVMGEQIKFLEKKDTGIDQNNLIIIPLPEQRDPLRTESFINIISDNSKIISATSSSSYPGNYLGDQVFKVENKEEGMVQQQFKTLYVGIDFINTWGIKLTQGRDFQKGNASDHYFSYIINESAAKELGWAEEPIGKQITYFHDKRMGSVIGVIKDFNYVSLHNKIEPLIIIYNESINNFLTVKISGSEVTETLNVIEKDWNRFFAEQPFEYEFMDQSFAALYEQDQIQHQLIRILSFTCIFISLLGLIGLSAFSASQKTKEIGIRKSFGASVLEILLLFSKDYLKIILIAFLLSIPVSNYIITEWLGNFAYQLTIGYGYFIVPGILIMVLTIVTVGFQAWKAAKASPVNSLTHE